MVLSTDGKGCNFVDGSVVDLPSLRAREELVDLMSPRTKMKAGTKRAFSTVAKRRHTWSVIAAHRIKVPFKIKAIPSRIV